MDEQRGDPAGARPDRVRRHTAPEVLARIDGDTCQRLIDDAASGEVPPARFEAMEREWDVDRCIEAEAALTGLAGIALAASVHRRFMLVPGLVASMLVVYALRGWYPLLPLLRRMGVRTSREIQREHYALKALRGDFRMRTEAARPLASNGSGTTSDIAKGKP